MVDEAPGFEEIAEDVYELLRDCVFVAHSVNFDYSFIKHQLKHCGYELNVPRLCTVRLSRKIFNDLPSYSLGNLCRSLSIAIEQRHRAQGDAKATALLFDKIVKLSTGKEVIREMLKRSSKEQWLPMQLSAEVVQELPAAPGVYYFLNAKRKVIYVGKALNIRKRVAGHFMPNNPELKRQQFLRHVTDIEHTVCASEFHALLLESIEIRRLWPRYNYAQKQPVKKYALYHFEDNRGYVRLCLDVQRRHLPALYKCNMLMEGQNMLRKIVEEFDLHPQLCYIDKTPVSELNGELPEVSAYNRKVSEALKALNCRLKTIALREPCDSENELCIFMEKGVFWGMGIFPAKQINNDRDWLKQNLVPYNDNDFLRSSVYRYAETYPERCIEIN